MAKPDWVDTILRFWFEELSQRDWFVANDDIDAAITERFGGLHRQLADDPPPQARSDAETALATVIVLDQFPRNMFRGSAKAFASDAAARDVAAVAIDNQLDKKLSGHQLQFLYMPFMHAENLIDQDRSVELFKALKNPDSLKFAIEHRDIVERFGRFPHRNRLLGRDTTVDEAEFLSDHSGFGQ